MSLKSPSSKLGREAGCPVVLGGIRVAEPWVGGSTNQAPKAAGSLPASRSGTDLGCGFDPQLGVYRRPRGCSSHVSVSLSLPLPAPFLSNKHPRGVSTQVSLLPCHLPFTSSISKDMPTDPQASDGDVPGTGPQAPRAAQQRRGRQRPVSQQPRRLTSSIWISRS